jgi:hypothetical protein
VVLILLLAAQRELGTLIKLIGVAFSWYVHHDEVFAQLVLVEVIHSHRVMIHLAVVLKPGNTRGVLRIDTLSTDR